MVEISKVKEYIQNNVDVKVIDINEDSVEVTGTNAEDLDELNEAGLEVNEVNFNNLSLRLVREEDFRKKYNRWVEEEKKI